MTMMRCGHAANAEHEGNPCCVICAGTSPDAYRVSDYPTDIVERKAKCGCGKVMSYSNTLAFYEYRGEGSRTSTHCKICGFSAQAHKEEKPAHYATLQKCKDEGTYTPQGGLEYDSFYCGHAGWD